MEHNETVRERLEVEDPEYWDVLLYRCAVWQRIVTFRKNILPPSSRLM
jgi:hypothetical protein